MTANLISHWILFRFILDKLDKLIYALTGSHNYLLSFEIDFEDFETRIMSVLIEITYFHNPLSIPFNPSLNLVYEFMSIKLLFFPEVSIFHS